MKLPTLFLRGVRNDQRPKSNTRMKAWQIPISGQGRGARSKAHYMPVSKDTRLIVQAACGRTFNPGFAERAKEPIPMCDGCARKIYVNSR